MNDRVLLMESGSSLKCQFRSGMVLTLTLHTERPEEECVQVTLVEHEQGPDDGRVKEIQISRVVRCARS